MISRLVLLAIAILAAPVHIVVDALIPLIDGGKGMPKMYNAYFDEQISKQACAASLEPFFCRDKKYGGPVPSSA